MSNELTYARAIEILRYDAQNGVLERKLSNGKWQICGDRPRRSDGRGRVNVDGKVYLAHRLVWLLVHGYMPEFIDHIDRNPMNNKISNLREATLSENQHNREMHKNNSSGYPGVSFFKRDNKYRVRLALNYKEIYIGLFDTAEEAFTAYMLAKIQYHPTSPIAQQYLRELTVAG